MCILFCTRARCDATRRMARKRSSLAGRRGMKKDRCARKRRSIIRRFLFRRDDGSRGNTRVWPPLSLSLENLFVSIFSARFTFLRLADRKSSIRRIMNNLSRFREIFFRLLAFPSFPLLGLLSGVVSRIRDANTHLRTKLG